MITGPNLPFFTIYVYTYIYFFPLFVFFLHFFYKNKIHQTVNQQSQSQSTLFYIPSQRSFEDLELSAIAPTTLFYMEV